MGKTTQLQYIKIPAEAFNDMDLLLSCIDVSSLGWDALEAYIRTERVFADKKERLEIRKAYYRLILAKTEEERQEERMNYLHRKH